MRKNWKSILCEIMEYLVLIAPTMGYSIYTYVDTLSETMSAKSKGAFWSLISAAIVCAVVFKIFKTRYERYVASYVQQKTDLETHPTDELLIKKVEEKSRVIENVDYLIVTIPILILLVVIQAFSNAIEQLMLILEIAAGSLLGKAGLHILTLRLEKSGMIAKISAKDGE